MSHVSHVSLSLFGLFGLFGFFGPSVMLHAPAPFVFPSFTSCHLDVQGLNVWRCTQVGTGQQISPGRSQHHCLPWSAERPPGRPASSGLLVENLKTPPFWWWMLDIFGGFNEVIRSYCQPTWDDDLQVVFSLHGISMYSPRFEHQPDSKVWMIASLIPYHFINIELKHVEAC